MNYKQHINKVKDVTLKKPYSYYFVTIFIAYIVLNLYINNNADVLFNFTSNFLVPYVFFTFIVASLVAINLNLVIAKVKRKKELHKGTGVSAVGAFTGLLAGACPGCITGLFPAFIGLFGVTAGVGILPLYGFELQIGATVLLVTSIYLMTKPQICKK